MRGLPPSNMRAQLRANSLSMHTSFLEDLLENRVVGGVDLLDLGFHRRMILDRERLFDITHAARGIMQDQLCLLELVTAVQAGESGFLRVRANIVQRLLRKPA